MKKWMAVVVILLNAATVTAAEKSDSTILALGDSLTYGEGGAGTTWPLVLESLCGRKVINQGQRGWIPRHMKYYFLLRDVSGLSVDQLKAIPPREYENRIHQPKINNLREIFAPQQTVVVRREGQLLLYRWNAESTFDDEKTIKPDAVGDTTHRPSIPTGRWIPEGLGEERATSEIVVIWLGANGMEAGDLAASVKDILASTPAGTNRKFLILGLINRLYFSSGPQDIAQWGDWIGQCNRQLKETYPENYLDLQSWFTASGGHSENGFRTRDWFPQATEQQVLDDHADQAAGIVPRSLRAPGNVTHLNAVGYTIIGKLVYQFLKDHSW